MMKIFELLTITALRSPVETFLSLIMFHDWKVYWRYPMIIFGLTLRCIFGVAYGKLLVVNYGTALRCIFGVANGQLWVVNSVTALRCIPMETNSLLTLIPTDLGKWPVSGDQWPEIRPRPVCIPQDIVLVSDSLLISRRNHNED